MADSVCHFAILPFAMRYLLFAIRYSLPVVGAKRI